MIEAASGMQLGDYFAEHLTGRSAMLDTAYVPTSSMSERLLRRSMPACPTAH